MCAPCKNKNGVTTPRAATKQTKSIVGPTAPSIGGLPENALRKRHNKEYQSRFNEAHQSKTHQNAEGVVVGKKTKSVRPKGRVKCRRRRRFEWIGMAIRSQRR